MERPIRKIKCEVCDELKDDNIFYVTYEYSDNQVCESCESNLENKTGHCSLYCRLSGNCDDAC